MRGPRQHYLPKLLLRGFPSRTGKREVHTWVFMIGREPFEASITDVGVSEHFYGSRTASGVDSQITDLEGEFAGYIDELRRKTRECRIGNDIIPDLVTHLMVRTKFVRDALFEVSDYVLELLTLNLLKSDNLERIILSQIRNHPEKFEKKVEQYLNPLPFSKRQKRALLQLAMSQAPKLLEQQIGGFKSFVAMLGGELRKRLPNIIKESHIQALRKSLAPEPRVDVAHSLNWFLTIRDEGTFILGDVGPISGALSSGTFKAIPQMEDKVEEILLPISASHLVIGTVESNPPRMDVENVNYGSSRCSNEFFVSSRNSDRERRYAADLAKNSNLISEKQLENMVNELLLELLE